MMRDYRGSMREKVGKMNRDVCLMIIEVPTHVRSFLTNLHDTQRLGLLHLAQDGSKDLVQLFPELGSRPRDEGGHQPAHECGCEL